MARKPTIASDDSSQARSQAEDAFQAYRALVLLQAEQPELARNDYFQALRDSSFARHLLTMEALK